ncbi:hypothetical protein KIH39_19185 [Telmatocola sphagniphila]|uniref:Uncharacterized protein n=1 Tax=Telmatocola sphagniphila TaxID=1123043 RepID=A0A8E6B3V9_9BACT|nr:hypothetical protein [Telmatocola sphagniphila]QVL30959.1 hypothetical protein KIH39_19185 [Telmatocola sphagniphila]
MTSILLKGVIRNGRVEGEQPINLPEGIRLIVTSGTEVSENGPLSEDEIARVQATMLKPGADGYAIGAFDASSSQSVKCHISQENRCF